MFDKFLTYNFALGDKTERTLKLPVNWLSVLTLRHAIEVTMPMYALLFVVFGSTKLLVASQSLNYTE